LERRPKRIEPRTAEESRFFVEAYLSHCARGCNHATALLYAQRELAALRRHLARKAARTA
jgi:hypothetical protein